MREIIKLKRVSVRNDAEACVTQGRTLGGVWGGVTPPNVL